MSKFLYIYNVFEINYYTDAILVRDSCLALGCDKKKIKQCGALSGNGICNRCQQIIPKNSICTDKIIKQKFKSDSYITNKASYYIWNTGKSEGGVLAFMKNHNTITLDFEKAGLFTEHDFIKFNGIIKHNDYIKMPTSLRKNIRYIAIRKNKLTAIGKEMKCVVRNDYYKYMF